MNSFDFWFRLAAEFVLQSRDFNVSIWVSDTVRAVDQLALVGA
jgi:hypothetical protein